MTLEPNEGPLELKQTIFIWLKADHYNRVVLNYF